MCFLYLSLYYKPVFIAAGIQYAAVHLREPRLCGLFGIQLYKKHPVIGSVRYKSDVMPLTHFML